MLETGFVQPALGLLFAAVILCGLLLLYLVNLVISAVGEFIEGTIPARLHTNAARQLDKPFARGKISLEEYRQGPGDPTDTNRSRC